MAPKNDQTTPPETCPAETTSSTEKVDTPT